MKILESAPSRYDRGIFLLTLGRLDRAYDRLASRIQEGQRVLDLGCGTGALTLRAAGKKAMVKGIDINPQMLEIAQERVKKANLTHWVELCEMGVAELGNENAGEYDVVTSGLCFSELSDDELSFTLREVNRVLKPGGLLLVADEVRPDNILKRFVNWALRIPLVVITYVITQASTSAIRDLPQKVEDAGLRIESTRLSAMETFIELEAGNPKEGEIYT